MKVRNLIASMTKFERSLWIVSMAAVTLSFALSPSGSILTWIASMIGVTALIFVAKGYVIGQILTVLFALFYGVISFWFHYYGEMITYLGMTSPIAILATISWIRHPYKRTKEVEVAKLTAKRTAIMLLLTALVTIAFYYILRAMGNASLVFSTMSVTTSFLASYLTFLRSPYYGLAYAANDLVLIVLWIIASIKDISVLPMIVCFVMFFINDTYGFINWKRMQQRQKS